MLRCVFHSLLQSLLPKPTGLLHWRMSNRVQATVPLTVFRSNSKFDQTLQCTRLWYSPSITTKFFHTSRQYCCRDMRKILLWSAKYEWGYCEILLNFEFDRNIVSGMGARYQRNSPGALVEATTLNSKFEKLQKYRTYLGGNYPSIPEIQRWINQSAIAWALRHIWVITFW